MHFTAMEISGHRKEGYTNEGQALQEEAEQVLLSLYQVILALCSLLGSHKMSFGGKKNVFVPPSFEGRLPEWVYPPGEGKSHSF